MGSAPFNLLSHAQAERLALLLEELGEAQQAIGKILRHGYNSSNPFDEMGTTNQEALERELGDVCCAVDILCTANDLRRGRIEAAQDNKHDRIWKYTHHQADEGRSVKEEDES